MTDDRFAPVIEEVEFLIAETKEYESAGPHFKVLHRFQREGTDCLPGEEVALVSLVHRSREFPIRLSLALRVLFDYLARHRHLPQSSAQIQAGTRNDAFCVRHGANAEACAKQAPRISRRGVKEYIKRLRFALRAVFLEAGLKLNPYRVLSSEATESNQVVYRLRASIDWVHI